MENKVCMIVRVNETNYPLFLDDLKKITHLRKPRSIPLPKYE
jgi:citrate lyase beta subunit